MLIYSNVSNRGKNNSKKSYKYIYIIITSAIFEAKRYAITFCIFLYTLLPNSKAALISIAFTLPIPSYLIKSL